MARMVDFSARLPGRPFVFGKIAPSALTAGYLRERDLVGLKRTSLTNGLPCSGCNAMSRDAISIQQALAAHWDKLRDQIHRVSSGVTFHPSDGYSLFQLDHNLSSTDVAVFNVGPVVINLPERASHHSFNLYVVAECQLGFDIKKFKESNELASLSFATHVAYFRRAPQELQHVYGVHYDFDTVHPAHPVFHAQMKSFAEDLSPHVKEQYGVELPIDDRVKGVLPNVRLPIAQLDFFSLVVQLAADHLIWQQSAQPERDAFNEILSLDKAIIGATTVSPSLTLGAELKCHRALHWYPPA